MLVRLFLRLTLQALISLAFMTYLDYAGAVVINTSITGQSGGAGGNGGNAGSNGVNGANGGNGGVSGCGFVGGLGGIGDSQSSGAGGMGGGYRAGRSALPPPFQWAAASTLLRLTSDTSCGVGGLAQSVSSDPTVAGSGGGGGGGQAGIIVTSANNFYTIANGVTVSGGGGGSGGNGGNGTSLLPYPSSGGGGGGGGNGLSYSQAVTIVNNGTIQGGNGGAGGQAGGLSPIALNAVYGAGGIGIAASYSSASAIPLATITNNGIILGGAGLGSSDGIYFSGSITNYGSVFGGQAIASSPSTSSSGVGIYALGQSTITNYGTIGSGLDASGARLSNAIYLINGGNTVNVEPGSNFIGNIYSASGSVNGGDKLALTGITGSITSPNIFDLSTVHGFNNFYVSGSVWSLTGSSQANVSGSSWTLSGGTLLLTSNNASELAGMPLNLSGGTLLTTNISGTNVSNNISLIGNTSKNYLDNGGQSVTYSGNISGGSSLSFAGLGVSTLSGTNSWVGDTTVSAGTTLNVNNGSSIGQGILTTNGAINLYNSSQSLQGINGSGYLSLNSTNLVVTNSVNASNFSGIVSGTGSVQIDGRQTFSNVNTYTGYTGIGGHLNLIGSGSISSSSGVIMDVNSGFDISLTSSGTSIRSLGGGGNPFDGSGMVFLGSQSLWLTNANATFGGVIADGGLSGGTGGSLAIVGGVETLTGNNAYTGSTTINEGATLVLSGSGGIATSSGVNNNGTFDISSKNGSVALSAYSQSSTGTLAMKFTPINNTQLNVTGAASLAGSLLLNASGGSYTSGKYTLLTASGLTGTFGSFTSNLSSYTRLSYSLAYDANDVLLIFRPNLSDTQQSLFNTATALQNFITLQNAAIVNGFTYDCPIFDSKGFCISAGGRNSQVLAGNANASSGLLIGSYRLDENNSRVGVSLDQNVSTSMSGDIVKQSNSTPMVGIFGVYQEKIDGIGWTGKLSVAVGQNNLTVQRPIVDTSESGIGSTSLHSFGTQALGKYGFGVTENLLASIYGGIRYTRNNIGGYKEGASSNVNDPLVMAPVNTNSSSSLIGVEGRYRVMPNVMTYVSAGLERNMSTNYDNYVATNSSFGALTPVNMNPNMVRTRPTVTLGAYYDIEKNQRLGVTGIYRQEMYQAVGTTTILATYTLGM